MNIRFGCCCLAMLFCSLLTGAQTVTSPIADGLPRHGVIGLVVVAADSSRPEDPATNPPMVRTVVSGGAGEAAGVHPGDILLDLDGQRIVSAADFAKAIGRHLAGDSIRLTLQRGGQKVEKTVLLKPRPYETSADAEVLYRTVTVEGARRRTIVTRPKAAGRYPAVLLIGGLGCYSLDGELNDRRGYGPILTGLVRKDFVTMRVEKTGEGDSEGPACTDPQATAELEAKGYAAGLVALRNYEFVDASKIFVFAHSLGPLLASLALPQQDVQGVVAAETIGRSWFEYTLENVRRQSALAGESLEQVDADVREHAKCAFQFFLQHETADEVAKLGEQCKEMLASYAGMPSAYMQQIGDLSLAKQWKQIDAPVLVIYGTSDPATSADESRYLVEIINSWHPGHAEYVEIPGMGHDFGRYSSQAEFLERPKDSQPHPFDDEVLTAIFGWLKQRLSS